MSSDDDVVVVSETFNNNSNKRARTESAAKAVGEAVTGTGEFAIDALQCPVCIDLLYDPCVVPCGHEFCKTCIQEVVRSSKHRGCPVCRANFTASSFGVNRRLKHLIEQLHPKESARRAREVAEDTERLREKEAKASSAARHATGPADRAHASYDPLNPEHLSQVLESLQAMREERQMVSLVAMDERLTREAVRRSGRMRTPSAAHLSHADHRSSLIEHLDRLSNLSQTLTSPSPSATLEHQTLGRRLHMARYAATLSGGPPAPDGRTASQVDPRSASFSFRPPPPVASSASPPTAPAPYLGPSALRWTRPAGRGRRRHSLTLSDEQLYDGGDPPQDQDRSTDGDDILSYPVPTDPSQTSGPAVRDSRDARPPQAAHLMLPMLPPPRFESSFPTAPTSLLHASTMRSMDAATSALESARSALARMAERDAPAVRDALNTHASLSPSSIHPRSCDASGAGARGRAAISGRAGTAVASAANTPTMPRMPSLWPLSLLGDEPQGTSARHTTRQRGPSLTEARPPLTRDDDLSDPATFAGSLGRLSRRTRPAMLEASSAAPTGPASADGTHERAGRADSQLASPPRLAPRLDDDFYRWATETHRSLNRSREHLKETLDAMAAGTRHARRSRPAIDSIPLEGTGHRDSWRSSARAGTDGASERISPPSFPVTREPQRRLCLMPAQSATEQDQLNVSRATDGFRREGRDLALNGPPSQPSLPEPRERRMRVVRLRLPHHRQLEPRESPPETGFPAAAATAASGREITSDAAAADVSEAASGLVRLRGT